MSKSTKQAGARFIARDKGAMGVPEVINKQQIPKPHRILPNGVRKRLKSRVDYIICDNVNED